jgi:hypothetical protein
MEGPLRSVMSEGIGDTCWGLMSSLLLLLESGVQKDASMSIGVALDVVLMEMLMMMMMMESALLLRIDRIAGTVVGGE